MSIIFLPSHTIRFKYQMCTVEFLQYMEGQKQTGGVFEGLPIQEVKQATRYNLGPGVEITTVDPILPREEMGTLD